MKLKNLAWYTIDYDGSLEKLAETINIEGKYFYRSNDSTRHIIESFKPIEIRDGVPLKDKNIFCIYKEQGYNSEVCVKLTNFQSVLFRLSSFSIRDMFKFIISSVKVLIKALLSIIKSIFI